MTTKATKIDVSFKRTQRDLRLFLAVNSMEEKSDFVKDAIEHYLEFLENNEKNKLFPKG